MKFYDCFIFNNELDLLEIRLKYYWDLIDVFVIVESDTTFSGKEKPFFFEENKERFKWAESKIKHLKNYVDRDKLDFDSDTSNNSLDHKTFRWNLETDQRNALELGYQDAAEEDFIIISDVDEFPKRSILEDIALSNETFHIFGSAEPAMFDLHIHYYYLNAQGPFNATIRGTSVAKKRTLSRGFPPQTQRYHTPQEIRDYRWVTDRVYSRGGWHFSYLGGVDAIIDKISSFSHTEFDTEKFKNRERIRDLLTAEPQGQMKDLFDREMNFSPVNFFTSNDYDDKLKEIIKGYPHLLYSYD